MLERGERTSIKDVRFNQKKDSRIDFEVLAEDEDCYEFSVYAEETETGYGLRNIQKWASPLGPEEKRRVLDLMEQLTEI
ncbi:MAG: hypothetical protein H8Z69_05345 [Nanohaloarchaea archaeon]|nr:hypothetical protein [Candidatus Nanohaloarchaea archaeon]